MSRAKEAAGRRAAEFVESGMTVGLGTGSTVHFTLLRLAERIADERLELRGVPTSIDTEEKSRALGIPLVGLEAAGSIDLTIDGADEIDGSFDMIKGGGGALLREKVVASLTRREVIVAGRGKLVEKLGREFMLPVEVVPFARVSIARVIEGLGATSNLRLVSADTPYLTDNGNEILDCAFEDGIDDAGDLERRLAMIPGIVESGLFVGLAHVLVIGDDDGTAEIRERPGD